MIFAAEGDASSTMISCPDASGLRFSIHAVSEVSGLTSYVTLRQSGAVSV
jgi:hypothetical protein